VPTWNPCQYAPVCKGSYTYKRGSGVVCTLCSKPRPLRRPQEEIEWSVPTALRRAERRHKYNP